VRNLTTLARQVRIEHRAANDAAQRWIQHARKAGRLLITAKTQLSHGQWLPWLSKHCRLSKRTAQSYMQLARLDPRKAQRVAHLSLRAALRTVATPKEARLVETYQVLVICKGEHEQRDLLDRLTREGYQCRSLMS
jgi:hypothetical protein